MQAARATALNTFVLSLIQQADPGRAPRRARPMSRCWPPPKARIERANSSANPSLALQMRRAIGAAYRNRGESPAREPGASQGYRAGARHPLQPNKWNRSAPCVQIGEENGDR